MKKIKAQIIMFNDNIDIDSPIKTINTPIIIGFLTYLYIPVITSFFVGFQGANVPLPILMNDIIVDIIKNNPIQINIMPDNKEKIFLMVIFLSINKGIKINAVNGSIKGVN